ncbi:hypothetical protein A2310_04125 [candidate division WOR-1 bacterium RIFOXYB2_FULL_37_13]|uniref:Uncharacterized protein n=1 Tax=candidate division WOR-1 bacterium RIFOXYB2_FULL_37_13 TaxID=1802579 RepID=A0A1F4STL5_UNCSA|nr:MAG: hypothetical protein A2310_04125 [candidate division WOR-1 bacterium RIFOXYB2_FULL_37_13]
MKEFSHKIEKDKKIKPEKSCQSLSSRERAINHKGNLMITAWVRALLPRNFLFGNTELLREP